MASEEQVIAPQFQLESEPTSAKSSDGQGSPLTRLGSATTYQSRLELSFEDDNLKSNLETSTSTEESGTFDNTGFEHTLQPQDVGFGAWSYVAAAFAMYIVVWGLPQALPVFQARLTRGQQAEFPGSLAISFLTPGIQDFQEGILFNILPRHARYRVGIVVAGIMIMITAFFLASFADSAWQVVVLQGYVFGVGGVMLNFVHVSVFSEWFDKRRGEAMGIIWTGFRLGAVASPLLCNWLLETHGYAQTLRVLIAPMLTLLGPSVILLRGRYPAVAVVSKPVHPSASLIDALRRAEVIVFLLQALFFNLITFMPVMFITTFAADIGVRFSEAVVILSVHNMARMLSTYLSGKLVKHHHSLDLILTGISFTTSLIYLFVWGFCKSREMLFIYAILIGLSTGAHDNACYPLVSAVSKNDAGLFTAIHSIWRFVCSLGTMSIGPVGALILRHSPSVETDAFALGKYQYLVIYGAVMSFLSGLISMIQAVSRFVPARRIIRKNSASDQITDGSAGESYELSER